MTEYGHYRVDCLMGVDGRVGPCCYDLCYCVADDYDGDVSCWFVEVATEMVCR